MDQDTEVQTSQEVDNAAAEAAFAASANDQPIEAPAVVETVANEAVAETTTDTVEVKEAAPEAPSPVALTAEELAELRANASKVSEFQTELRKAHGRIGALNDLLHQQMKAKESEGKPAVLTATELKRTKEQFPELSEFLGEDIREMMAGLQSPNTQSIESVVEQALEKKRQDALRKDIEERQEELEEEHPDARQVFASPAFQTWFTALPENERQRMEKTKSVAVLSKKLTVFKAWNAEQAARDAESAKAKQQSKKRLESAITPMGVGGGPGHNVLSDREAAEKAFADASKF